MKLFRRGRSAAPEPERSATTPAAPETSWPEWVAFDPALLPPSALMREEGVSTLEEWFRWAEEWAMLLRIYGGARVDSNVLEIGCGVGRLALPLRYLLLEGSYDGFDIRKAPIAFLQQNFTPVHSNFRFHHADLVNSYYNARGSTQTSNYRVPVGDASIDLVFAASIFTHMLPGYTSHYFHEAARALRPGGRCVFSFFLLDNYRPGAARPLGFARPDFNLDHHLEEFGDGFALAFPDDPERMTGYSLTLIRSFADAAGLEIEGDPLPGLWSGSFEAPIAAQDLVILRKPGG